MPASEVLPFSPPSATPPPPSPLRDFFSLQSDCLFVDLEEDVSVESILSTHPLFAMFVFFVGPVSLATHGLEGVNRQHGVLALYGCFYKLREEAKFGSE